MEKKVEGLRIGQKVRVLRKEGKPHKHSAEGHICRISNAIRFSVGFVRNNYKYELEWCPEDNPGKHFPLLITRYFFYDDDIEAVNEPTLSSTTKSLALPEV